MKQVKEARILNLSLIYTQGDEKKKGSSVKMCTYVMGCAWLLPAGVQDTSRQQPG